VAISQLRSRRAQRLEGLPAGAPARRTAQGTNGQRGHAVSWLDLSDFDTAADKIAKVRELALLPPWQIHETKARAELAHYRACLTMLRRVARDLALVPPA
jgi:hypothetical protein